MKIGIISIGDLKYTPFLYKYTEILEKNQMDYDVLFWNRENAEIEVPNNFISFNRYSKLNKSPVKKIWDFYLFRKWCIRKIKENDYDRLILLMSLSGILLADKILHSYKNRYIFDIRDYSYEDKKWFWRIETKIIQYSYATSISSEGFRRFLPESDKYVISHNHNPKDDAVCSHVKEEKYADAINVGFLGSLRYFEYQKKIIEHLANDSRFQISYYGKGPEEEEFVAYKKKKQIENLYFGGSYDNCKKGEFLQQIDILNNSYGSENIREQREVQYAISNKYYDGLQWKIPQLVEVESYKAERIERLGLGIALNVNDRDFADKLFQYYHKFNRDQFENSTVKELAEICKDEHTFEKIVCQFSSGMGEQE